MHKILLFCLILLPTLASGSEKGADSVSSAMLQRISDLYNREETSDSTLLHWVDSLGRYALKHGLHSDYFEGESYACQQLIYHSRFNEAMQRLRAAADLARKLNNRMGRVNTYENYGVLYQMIWRYDEARESFEAGLELLREKDERHGFQLQFLSYLIEIALERNDLDQAQQRLDEYGTLVARFDRKTPDSSGAIDEETIRRCRKLFHVYSLQLELKRHDLRRSALHMEQLATLNDVDDHYVNTLETCYTAMYYAQTGQYDRALQTLGESHTEGLIDLQMKQTAASVYYKTGEYKRAAETYRTTVALLDSLNNKEFVTKISEMYSLHEVDMLQLRLHEEQMKQAHMRERNIRSFVLLLILILIVICGILARTYRLKSRLERMTDDLKQERNALIVARNKAQESDKLKESFLQNINHEIRTPLNAISGFSEIIAHECSDREELKEYADTVRKNSELLLSLVHNIMDMSLLESEISELQYQNISAAELLRFVILNTGPMCKPDVNLKFCAVPDELTLEGNFHQLTQVLINLVNNACKFTERGYIELRAERAGSEIRFSVTDTGCGIPVEKQQVIFERFCKLDKFRSGSGLGLSISKLIVEKMNGRLYVDGNYTPGARFIVVLPQATRGAA